jgi:hypothetical protein
MLAALLCNLTDTPAPPPAVPQPFFGGGPFLKRYGYDPRYYRQPEDKFEEARALRDELPPEKVEIVETAIVKAVHAIRTEPEPRPIVIDAKRIYVEVIREVRMELGLARIERKKLDELWKAEIQRRVREQEEEEIALLLSL